MQFDWTYFDECIAKIWKKNTILKRVKCIKIETSTKNIKIEKNGKETNEKMIKKLNTKIVRIRKKNWTIFVKKENVNIKIVLEC